MAATRKSLLAATLIFAACATNPPPTADAQLHRLVEGYFEQVLKLNPLLATFIGDARYNDRLSINIAPEHIAAMVELHRNSLAVLNEIDATQLAPALRLTFEIFERECNQALIAAKFPSHLLPLNQMGGLPATFAALGAGGNAQPFVTVRDYENFLRRGMDFSRWVDQAIDNMREGMRQGVVQPRIVMEKVLPQLEAMLVDDASKSLFFKPIDAFPNSFSSGERERLANEYRSAIEHRLVPAYRRLRDFIRDEYLPHTRASIAWTALPQGEAWYRFLADRYTTTALSPTEIHRIGLAEVARIRGEMRKVQVKLGIAGELKDFFQALAVDESQYFTKGAELLAAHRAIKANISAKLPTLFVDFPKADYEIREVEAFRAQASAGAFYQQPSADGSRPGIFYVNTYNLKAQPKFGLTTLSLHEAAPGHHFQISLQQEVTDMPRFRRFLVGYTAYTEGWALYSEWLGNELQLFDDPYQYFGHLNDEMLRAMRLVVDTGLHTLNWSREQAIAYMLDNSYMAATDAEAEVDRYIANAGQALGYKIGQLRIRELREQAQTALGAKFDVKAFHSQVLRDGALPMDVLAAKLERWQKSVMSDQR